MRLTLTMLALLSQAPANAIAHPLENPKSASSTQQAKPKPAIPNIQPKPNPQQPTAEDRIASYTGWLMGFTGVLAVGTLGLFWIAWQQGKQIEREFLATHRPRLILRRVTFERDDARPWDASISIANTGESEAIISELAVALQPFMGDPPAWEILELLDGNPVAAAKNFVLPTGDSYPLVVHARSNMAEAYGMNRAQRGLFSIYCIGFVEYRDKIGNSVRRTGFIRRAQFDGRYFERVDLHDFEYAD